MNKQTPNLNWIQNLAKAMNWEFIPKSGLIVSDFEL